MATETDPVQIQIQTNQMFEEKKHCCGCCRRSPHVLGLFCCIIVWFLLIYTICAYSAKETDYYGGLTLGLLVVAYIIYLIEAFVAKTSRYLWNMKVPGGEDIGMYINRMKNQPPVLSMSCECYHYETRTRYVTETYTEYVNGQSVTRTRTRVETYQEKVVTYNGYEVFHYNEWSDNSGFLVDEILKYNVVRIEMLKSWLPANPETEAAFNHQYAEFRRKHENFDTHFNSWQTLDIDGYEQHVLWVVEQKWWLNWSAYAVFTIIYLSSVFYRYCFGQISVKANFQLKKVIKL